MTNTGPQAGAPLQKLFRFSCIHTFAACAGPATCLRIYCRIPMNRCRTESSSGERLNATEADAVTRHPPTEYLRSPPPPTAEEALPLQSLSQHQHQNPQHLQHHLLHARAITLAPACRRGFGALALLLFPGNGPGGGGSRAPTRHPRVQRRRVWLKVVAAVSPGAEETSTIPLLQPARRRPCWAHPRAVAPARRRRRRFVAGRSGAHLPRAACTVLLTSAMPGETEGEGCRGSVDLRQAWC